MKQFVAPIIALALVITALFLPLSSSNAISAGPGDGTDAEIETLEEATEVLDSVLYLSRSLARSSRSSLEHDSVTLYFERDTHIGISYDSTGRDMSMKSSNTYYIDEDQVYIICDGIITTSSQQKSSTYYDNSSNASYVRVKAEIYYSKSETLMKINDFEVITTNSSVFTPAVKNVMLNKWIDLKSGGSSIMSMFNQVMDMNTEFLELLRDYASHYDSDEFFKNNNSVYTLKSDASDKFFDDVLKMAVGSIPFDVEVDGDFVVDLSDSTSPRIELEVDYDFPDSFTKTERVESSSGNYYDYIYGGTYEEVTYDISANGNYEKLVYEFANIDNTEIEFDLDSDDIYTMQEIEELIEEVA